MMEFIQKLDLMILNAIYKLQNPVFDTIMPVITSLANGGFLWILICLICLTVKKTRKCGISVAFALAMNFLASNVVLKNFVARKRPFSLDNTVKLLIEAPKDYSFPSGHTSASFAAATVIYAFNKKWGIASYVLAFLIAFSRLYLYVHYPTDVICGAVIGFVSALTAVKLLKEK